jgi:cytochrome c peroxidase
MPHEGLPRRRWHSGGISDTDVRRSLMYAGAERADTVPATLTPYITHRKESAMSLIRHAILPLGLALYGSLSMAGHGPLPAPLTDSDYYDHGPAAAARIDLGRKLFHDKLLSGNRNISCATCHHAMADTGDWLSLPVGEGGRGLGPARDTGRDDDAIHERVPRNAPPVFNLGAREFTVMFHDGRLEQDPQHPSGFLSPAGDDLPAGLDNVLAAQAMFPVTSGTEMAGQPGENPVADAAAVDDLPLVWELLAQRLRDNEEYVGLFMASYPDGPDAVRSAGDITFVQAANAIGTFEAEAWRIDNSPYDRHLRGDRHAMSAAALRGLRIFRGRGNCVACHSGPFQTDQSFHAIAMPQIGPGKGDNLPGYRDGRDDFGRERVTGDPADRFRFRTPSLRNIALTGPWGHAGAYGSLEAVVRHHLDPIASLYRYDPGQAILPSREDLDAIDFAVMADPARLAAIAAANELAPVELDEAEIDDLLEFLHALTDPAAHDLRGDVPKSVPGGESLAD